MPLRKYGLISLVEKTKTKNFLDPSWLHSSWKESLYIRPLLFISFHSSLNLFCSGFCLRHFTETLVQVTSNLLVAKSNDPFSTPILPNLPAAFDKAEYSCFPETLCFLGDYNIPVLTLWPVPQSPLWSLPISECCSGPWLSFFLSTLTPLLISNLTRVLNANDFDFYLTEFLDLPT